MSNKKIQSASYRKIGLPCIVISISDVDAPPLRLAGNPDIRAVLRLNFADTGAGSPEAMQPADAERIAAFVGAWEKDAQMIIVSCEAGISRSPAVAAAVMRALGKNDMEIWKNPNYRPNSFCYRLTFRAFGFRCIFIHRRAAANRKAFRKCASRIKNSAEPAVIWRQKKKRGKKWVRIR